MFNYVVNFDFKGSKIVSNGTSGQSGIISQTENFNANAFIVRTPEARKFLLENWNDICFNNVIIGNVNYSVKN